MSKTLLTGSTGFIGSSLTHRLLQEGHTLILTIRHADQAPKLRRIFAPHASQLEFAVVPDITVPGCYDDVLHDVGVVFHLASPLTQAGGKDMVSPAVKGTREILGACLRAGGVRKVVVTGSVMSLVSIGGLRDGVVISEDDEVDYTIPENPDGVTAYHASKLAAHRATLDFYQSSQPSFDLVTLHPVFVFGRSLVQDSAQISGSCGILYGSLFAEKPVSGQFLGVHIDDVVEAHVRVLDDKVKGFREFLLAGERRSWGDVKAFVERRFPDLPIRLQGVDYVDYRVDAGRAERELGISFKGLEEMVGDVVCQQLEFK
ncbi:hypothetical protein BDV25DRAFT_139921 [Aspergillus avenaceus]|uniref:NAD-dependent epimerase/dehydratase domain-containing protein n=1 Tax=Aspergillus avenaceus TaxID=36643 RepID=A0A5N6TVE7_ASPAV|nr:hypothetical protein BDV25DRAFT_139921 [Aspergillus avenaceus]